MLSVSVDYLFRMNLAHSCVRTGDFQKNDTIHKIGGGVGIVTALVAYYCGLSELLTEDDIFTLPLGKYPPKMA